MVQQIWNVNHVILILWISRQGICNNCCILLGVAKLSIDSEIKTKSPIFTKDIKPNINFKELAELAFNAGKHSNLDFDTWYNQQIL